MSTTDTRAPAPASGPPAKRTEGQAAARGRRAWRPGLSRLHGLALSLPFIFIVLLFVAYPFIRLVKIALGPPGGLENLTAFLDNGANLRVLGTTFWVSALVTLLSVALGANIAWSLKTTRSRFMRLLMLSAIFVPFWMGSVIKLYAWTILLQTYGLINRILMGIGLTNEPLHLLYNETAVVIGMVYQMLPYSVLPLYVAFHTIDLDLIRAAESLGASRLRALASVVVPLAAPGVLATVIIVYVISIGFFLTPVVLGGFTAPFSASLIAQNIFDFFDLIGAAVTAVFLLFGGLAVVLTGYKLVGKDRLRKALG